MFRDRLNRPTSGFATRRHMLEYEAALVDAAHLDAAFEVPSLWSTLYPALLPCTLRSCASWKSDMVAR